MRRRRWWNRRYWIWRANGVHLASAIRTRVTRARERQRTRWDALGGTNPRSSDTVARGGTPTWNAALTPSGVARWCRLEREGARLMEGAADRLGLSARGVHRVLKVARTIADLAGAERIQDEDLAEAVQYRG
ncbi:MAG: hypothetical protein WEG36_10955 [Gemmatimonadota bacterium]